MLTIYRRHSQSCGHRSEGWKYRHCRCPIWVDGFLRGKELRQSLGTRDWAKAQKTVHEWEAAGLPANEKDSAVGVEGITIDAAKEEFLADCEARKLKKSSIDRYRILFRQLDAFARREGIRFLAQLLTPELHKFRATWQGSSGLADLKKLERLR